MRYILDFYMTMPSFPWILGMPLLFNALYIMSAKNEMDPGELLAHLPELS
jgi:hypothetical protein